MSESTEPGTIPAVDRRRKKGLNAALKEKTFKREYAAVLMAVFVSSYIRVFWFVPPEAAKSYEGLLAAMSWPILMFVAATAGIHSFMRGPKAPPGRDS